MKKADEALVGYLTLNELQALLDAPDLRVRSSVRDRAMLHLAFAAGLRVSELTTAAAAATRSGSRRDGSFVCPLAN
jgi:integrase/recombinase XerD